MPRLCGATAVLQLNLDKYPELRVRQTTLTQRLSTQAQVAAVMEQRDIPVVVHILHSDPNAITDAQVQSQIDVLNEDFSASNADIGGVPGPFSTLVGNPGIRFHLADNGIIRKLTNAGPFSTDDLMKADATGGSSPRDPQHFLNIWVCDLTNGVLGYAQFPDGGPAATDGVVIVPSAFGRNGTAQDPYHLGRTTTHEVGHYLGLFHIWGNNPVPSCSDDDEVLDTPPQLGPNYSAPTFPHVSCPGSHPHGDMFMNYMDYVPDEAMIMFSVGQVERMKAVLQVSRSQLGV